jgi:phosphatidylserine decarboxylase
VLFGPNQVKWSELLAAGSPVRMGEGLALPLQA